MLPGHLRVPPETGARVRGGSRRRARRRRRAGRGTAQGSSGCPGRRSSIRRRGTRAANRRSVGGAHGSAALESARQPRESSGPARRAAVRSLRRRPRHRCRSARERARPSCRRTRAPARASRAVAGVVRARAGHRRRSPGCGAGRRRATDRAGWSAGAGRRVARGRSAGEHSCSYGASPPLRRGLCRTLSFSRKRLGGVSDGVATAARRSGCRRRRGRCGAAGCRPRRRDRRWGYP